MLKTCRKYLIWVQNSVFEGEISDANYEKLMHELKDIIIKEDDDSIVIYKFRKMQYFKREVIGADKKDDINFI
jgi:CRISPR-associated protein Cas2